MNFFTKDERNAVLILTITFMVGFSILSVRDNNRDSILTLIENNQEISDIVKPAQTLSGKLNLNNASEDKLISLPGIDPVTAEKIIAKRLELGSFPAVDDLFVVSGIGAKTGVKILEFIEGIENCIHKIY